MACRCLAFNTAQFKKISEQLVHLGTLTIPLNDEMMQATFYRPDARADDAVAA